MKNQENSKWLAFCVLILSACLAPLAQSQTNPRSPKAKIKTKLIKVYFFLYDESKPIETLEPVARRVSAATPARGALQELLTGPTPTERKRGYAEFDCKGLTISKLLIEKGVATVDFAARPTKSWLGDLSPVFFLHGVQKTLKQFPNVKQVKVSVNGDDKFYSEM